jgi:hypothetical protein
VDFHAYYRTKTADLVRCPNPFAIFSSDYYLVVGIHQRPSTANQRWRSRTASQQNRRKKWTEPTAPLGLVNANTYVNSLSGYSRPDYLVGNSTPQALADVRDRLGHDLEPMPVAELSAVEGLIYEMMDTSRPSEMEGSVPVVVTRAIVEDEAAPSAFALPRKPPKVYRSQVLSNASTSDLSNNSASNISNAGTSQLVSAVRADPQVSVKDGQNESATAEDNDDLYDDTATSHATPLWPPEQIYGSVSHPNEQQGHEMSGNDYFHSLPTTLDSFIAEPGNSSWPTGLASSHNDLVSTPTSDSTLEEQNGAPDRKKTTPEKSSTWKELRKIFR